MKEKSSNLPNYQPLITVAMPFHNCGSTIAQSIYSVLWQTYDAWELVLYDDGSSDGGREVARSFDDPRIRLLLGSSRKGLAARLNDCIDHARGTLFARMDGDDISLPDRFEKQVTFLKSNPQVDLVGTAVFVFSGRGHAIGKRVPPVNHEAICSNPDSGFKIAHPSWMGRIEWFRKYRYSACLQRNQDLELLWRSHEQSIFANLTDLLVGYRDEMSLSKVFNIRKAWLDLIRDDYRSRKGLLKALLLSAAILGKTFLEITALVTGLEHVVMRYRAAPLLASEKAKWEQTSMRLRKELSAMGYPNTPPV